MADVLPFKRPGTLEGRARCLNCNHEWQAVAERFNQLQCPSCGLYYGIMMASVGLQEGEMRYVCECGCDVHYIKPDRIMCVRCGEQIRTEDL